MAESPGVRNQLLTRQRGCDGGRPVVLLGWRAACLVAGRGGKCLGLVAAATRRLRPAARRRPSRDLVFSINELEQLAHDVRGFATEVRRLGYSSVAGGHENRFLELSERMMRQADQERRRDQVAAHDIGHLVGLVDVECDSAGSPDMQRDPIVGPREPRDDLLGVAAGLGLPVLADDAAGVSWDRRGAPERRRSRGGRIRAPR